MSETRDFALGAVLTVTTDIMLSDMGTVYEILNYMTRDNLFTHQLPRAMRECAPHLLRQHPALAPVDVSDVTPDNVRERLAALEAQYGSALPIAPIPRDDHSYRDPVQELVGMVGPDRVVVVNPEAPDAHP